MTNSKGIIYVMTTAVDGLIKIGKTGSDKFKERMRKLEKDGYYNMNHLKKEFAIEVSDYNQKEDLIKKLFSRSRVGNSELYSLDLQQVISLLSSFEGKQIYPTNESKQKVFEQATGIIESRELPDGDYYLNSNTKGLNGKEKLSGTLRVKDSKLTLLKGAIISSYSKIGVLRYSQARDLAKKNGNILQEDILCDSVSMAATIVCGYNLNGWDKWKDKQGKKIDLYRQMKTIED